MLNKKEKKVMEFLFKRGLNKKSVLIAPQEIINSAMPKYELTEADVDSILNNLVLENYIDLVNSTSKGKLIYCIALKEKGESFARDKQNVKKGTAKKIATTIALAVLSFVVGMILRSIFKK